MSRIRNPWVQKRSSLSGFDLSNILVLAVMGYGFYNAIDWSWNAIGRLLRRLPTHSG